MERRKEKNKTNIVKGGLEKGTRNEGGKRRGLWHNVGNI